MIIFIAPSSSSSFHQRYYNYKIKKWRREKMRETKIIIHVKMFLGMEGEKPHLLR